MFFSGGFFVPTHRRVNLHDVYCSILEDWRMWGCISPLSEGALDDLLCNFVMMYCELNSFFTTIRTHFSVLGSHFQKSSRSEHIGSLFGLNCGLLLIALATFKVVVSHLDTTSAKTLFAHLHTLSKLLNLSSKLKLNTKINKMAISCIFFYSNTTLKYILNLKKWNAINTM